MPWFFVVICMLLGSVVGMLAGLLGIGGGLLVVPSLSLLLPWAGVSSELAMPMALATSLSSIVVTSFSSARSHHRLGNLNFSAAHTLLPGLLVGGCLGGAVADAIASAYLSKIFGGIVLLLSLQMLLSVRFSGNKSLPNAWIGALIGGGIGTISSLAGIGGGSLVVPYLNYHGIEMRQAIGTASVCGMFLATFAMISFIFFGIQSAAKLPSFSLGYVYVPALLGIVTTSVMTTSLGAKLASRLPTATIKRCFALFLCIVGISMLIKG